MSRQAIDETGNRYGALKVIKRHGSKNGKATWLCRCDCGRKSVTYGNSLRSGRVKSCGCARGNSTVDETGNRYGKLTVLGFSHSDNGAYWKCRCDCGSEIVASGSNLRRGWPYSCGCAYELEPGEAAMHQVYWKNEQGAEKRGLVWKMTMEEFVEISQKHCHYCGCEPSNEYGGGEVSNGRFVYNGIDRMDNEKGYTADNVVPCCHKCNFAKGTLGYSEFLDLCAKVAAHHELPANGVEEIEVEES